MKSALPIKVVLPMALGIVASLAVAVYAELGYRRLEVANRQMSVALEIQASLQEMFALIVDAETGERGYLLTGKDEYLAPYHAASPKIESTFNRLGELLVREGSSIQRDALARVNSLVGKKLGEIEATVELRQRGDAQSSQALTDAGLGKRTMDQIRVEVDAMAAMNRRKLDDATSHWSADISFARLGMQMMTGFTVALLLVVWFLARRDAQQREGRRHSAVQDAHRLEALVGERTAELSELSNYLQSAREDEKAKLARDIHDELGGILVSAKMDVSWVEERLRASDPESAAKLERTLQVLDDGVQIKRRIIEDLRPTLLDNLGLSAAMEWQVQEICERAGLECAVATPKDDSPIAPQVGIALYRILQEALTNIVKYARAHSVSVDLGLTAETVTLLIEDDGIGIPPNAQSNLLSHGIAGMRQRVRALNGEFAIARKPEGGTTIEVNIPMQQAPGASPQAPPDDA